MFGLSFSIAVVQAKVASSLRVRTQQVKRWGGYVLIIVGLWLIALAIWADFFASVF